MMPNIQAWNEYAGHCNACGQCTEANAEADPEAHCAEGRRLWEEFQDAQQATANGV